jgi:uncharacterized damage-inducible protein DinB
MRFLLIRITPLSKYDFTAHTISQLGFANTAEPTIGLAIRGMSCDGAKPERSRRPARARNNSVSERIRNGIVRAGGSPESMKLFLCAALATVPMFAAGPIATLYDNQLTIAERQVMGLAQAMPADKYNFAPTNGTFKGVRTFGQQLRHIATVMYSIAAPAVNQKSPYEPGPADNGPDSIQTKEQILEYLRNAFALGHKSIQGITDKNQLEKISTGEGEMERGAAAAMLAWHAMDHYGQMVVYARMNGVVPGQPPAAK